MAENWISPDDLQKAAEGYMLDGRKPASHEDWMECCNFWAANISKGVEVPICRLMNMLFEAGLSDEEIKVVCAYQATHPEEQW